MEIAIKISIVVPVYNEEANVAILHDQIVRMCKSSVIDSEPFDWEIIFVDDGSTDDTPAICKTLSPIRYIRLNHNYGQTAAMDCGIKKATGDYIATMDGDGQNDPNDIPRLLQYLIDNNLDVVSGWRRNRQDPMAKKMDSRVANIIRQRMVHDGIHDSGCTLKVYRKECFEDLSLYGDQHRFIPALLKSKGFKIGEMEVTHHPRLYGKTKYNYKRFYKGLRDLNEIRRENMYNYRPDSLYGQFNKIMINRYYKRFSNERYYIYEEVEQ